MGARKIFIYHLEILQEISISISCEELFICAIGVGCSCEVQDSVDFRKKISLIILYIGLYVGADSELWNNGVILSYEANPVGICGIGLIRLLARLSSC